MIFSKSRIRETLNLLTDADSITIAMKRFFVCFLVQKKLEGDIFLWGVGPKLFCMQDLFRRRLLPGADLLPLKLAGITNIIQEDIVARGNKFTNRQADKYTNIATYID